MSKTFALSISVGAALTASFGLAFSKAKKNITSFGSTIKSLESGQAKLTRFRNLKTGINQTEKALADAQTEVSRLAREMATVENPSSQMTGAFNRAKATAKRLKMELDTQRVSLHSLRGEMAAAGLKTKGLAAQNTRLAKAITKAKNAQKGLKNVMAAKSAVAAKRSQFRSQALDAVALGYALQVPFRAAINFEQSMAEVKSISGATDCSFKKLTGQAKQLGRDTLFSASEAAQGMKYLSMAGFDVNQTMAAMPGLLNLAQAAGSDLGFTADAASDILSAFKMKAADMGTVGDVLVKTFTTSNTSMELLTETMKYVAPVANAAGMSLQETAAMAGMLGNVGIKGSQAGTAMRAAIVRLAGPPRMAAKALAKLGVATKDAGGNMRPVVDILADLAAKTQSMGSGDRLESFKKIFGVEAAAAMTEMVGQAGAGGIQKYIEKIRAAQGAAAQVAKTQANTTRGTMKALGSAMESLAITSATLFFPAVRAMASGLRAVANATTGLVARFPIATKIIGGLVAGLIGAKIAGLALGYTWTYLKGGFLAVKGAILGVKSALILARTYTVAFGLASKATAAGQAMMTAAQWALNVALNANPIGLVVAGVAALGAAAYVVWRNWATIKSAVLGFWDSITGFFDNFSLADCGMKIIKTLVSGITSVSMAPFNAVKAIFSKVRSLLPFSDAKTGPLSDLTGSGQAIVRTIARGVRQEGKGRIGAEMSRVLSGGIIPAPGASPAWSMRRPSAPFPRIGNCDLSTPSLAGAVASGPISITLAPKIYLNGSGAPEEVRRSVDLAMGESERRLMETMSRINHNERRLAFV